MKATASSRPRIMAGCATAPIRLPSLRASARCGHSKHGATTTTVFTRLTGPTPASSARPANELTVQYGTFLNTITSDNTASTERFPNGVITGLGLNTPQGTEQQKIHIHDDLSWHVTGAAVWATI